MLSSARRELGLNADPHAMPPASADLRRVDGESGSDKPRSQESGWRLIIWLFRIRALLFVTLCATFGVLLIIFPWTPKWTDNPLLLLHPDLRDFVSSGFVRGLATGLGILDLCVGFWEAIHYHEPPRPS